MISRNHRSSRRLRLRQSCRRSELAAAQIGANSYGYAYDSIGNRQWFSANGVTNGYAANCLNQYSSVEQSTFNIQPTYPDFPRSHPISTFPKRITDKMGANADRFAGYCLRKTGKFV